MVANGEDGHYFFQTFGNARALIISLTQLLFLQGIKVIFLFAGFSLTYLILENIYGNQAISQFIKGISILNIINMIIEQNLLELSLLVYFLFLFGFFLFFDRILIKRVIYSNSQSIQKSILPQITRYFREGSLTIPFIVMIGSPLLVQIILPTVIIFIALVELLTPFAILGVLYRLSEKNFLKLVKEIRWRFLRSHDRLENENQKNIPTHELVTIKNSYQIAPSSLLNLLIMIFVFPFAVFLLVELKLDQLLHILHFMLLNENSGVSVSIFFWEIINTFISFISFNIEIVSIFFNSLKQFIVTFLVLIPICKLFILITRLSRTQLTRILETYIFKY